MLFFPRGNFVLRHRCSAFCRWQKDKKKEEEDSWRIWNCSCWMIILYCLVWFTSLGRWSSGMVLDNFPVRNCGLFKNSSATAFCACVRKWDDGGSNTQNRQSLEATFNPCARCRSPSTRSNRGSSWSLDHGDWNFWRTSCHDPSVGSLWTW